MIRALAALAVLVPAMALAASAPPRISPGRVVLADAEYPESPEVDGDRILVAEMVRDVVTAVREGKATTAWRRPGCGPTSVKRTRGGYWILCHIANEVVLVDGGFRTLRVIDRTPGGEPIGNPNDSAVDADGSLYFSSPGPFDLAAPATGRVIRIERDTLAARVVQRGLKYSNGVFVDRPGGRLLVSEHLAGRVLSFPILVNGDLGKKSVFFDFRRTPPPAVARYVQSGPDGIRRLCNGDFVVADYGNARFVVIHPQGELAAVVPTTHRYITNFATPAGREFFVTMSRSNTPPTQGIVQAFRLEAGGPGC